MVESHEQFRDDTTPKKIGDFHVVNGVPVSKMQLPFSHS